MRCGKWLLFPLLLSACLLPPTDRPAAEGHRATQKSIPTRSDFKPPPIRVPAGFVVELVAGPPLVKYPMMACLDERGRLFIAESDGQNLGKDELLKQRPRFVRMLEDTDGDGIYDRSTIFADRMVMPEGALWHDGALYLVSAPYLWRLQDTDGDGVADRRERLVGEMNFIGNANQHGPYLSPDGRLYFSGGTYGYDLLGKDGKRGGKGNWAGVFSCRSDGTDVRVECHAGINPVEVIFTPEGDLLGTCAIFDQKGGRHDALVHWVHGASYVERLRPPTLKQTGRYLPAVRRWGQVAPAGLVRYRGTHLGEGFRDNLFACQFNTHAVVRVRLQRDGATFRAEDEVFLDSPSIDFHPADVLEDADGSLLVVDTGGWLTMGCPTSKIAKPEVFGAVYRVRKVGRARPSDPRGLKLEWTKAEAADLVRRLDDPRPVVRDRAVAALAGRSDRAVPALGKALQPPSSSRLRRNAVWALARIGTPAARALLCRALADRDGGVRQAAACGLGNLREVGAVAALIKLVVDDEPAVRREAATALGLIGSAKAVPSLLQSLRTGREEFLEHALIYALIEINDAAATAAGLAGPAPHVRRAALIALDQMPAGRLTREMVAPLLGTTDPDLQQAALDVIGKHPGWAGEIVGLLKEWLQAPRPDSTRDSLIAGAVLAFPRDAKVQSLVADALTQPAMPRATVLLLLETIARCELDRLPAPWVEVLAKLLSARDRQVRRQAVATIAAHDAGPFEERLLAVARGPRQDTGLRVAALTVLARRGTRLDEDGLKLLLDQINPDVPPVERLAAADALGKAALDEKQLARLPALVARAGPLELPPLLRAFETAARATRGSGELGLRLVDALAKSPGAKTLSAGRIQAVLDLYPAKVREAGRRRLAQQTEDDRVQRARLAEVVAQVKRGDAERGRQVFFSNRSACSTCHRLAGVGGPVGPDLSKIGQVRTTRDLAEAVLFPSATLANGYESYTVITRAGQTHTGMIRRETADAIYLFTTDRSEVRIPRTQIEEMTPSSVSVMPQGLEKVLSAEQLRDLIAFLGSLK
ncbi:MAG: HEAT repeat domain-containing protein [Planctomycetes bacterium]|nr:HEAT repeat domain-containing protein [Planctomycetota bacterium]